MRYNRNMTKSIQINDYPPGFSFFDEFITPHEEEVLITHLQKLDWQVIKMHGVVARRRVVHFGYDYTYDNRSVKPTSAPPDFLKFVMERAAKIMRVETKDLQEILITDYPEGAPIGWHRDAPMFEKIFGLSLLNSCIFKLRKQLADGQYIVYKAEIPPRSAYILEGPARTEWQHHIPPVKARRYSITLRTFYKNR